MRVYHYLYKSEAKQRVMRIVLAVSDPHWPYHAFCDPYLSLAHRCLHSRSRRGELLSRRNPSLYPRAILDKGSLDLACRDESR